jgi:hypothetical protein
MVEEIASIEFDGILASGGTIQTGVAGVVE